MQPEPQAIVWASLMEVKRRASRLRPVASRTASTCDSSGFVGQDAISRGEAADKPRHVHGVVIPGLGGLEPAGDLGSGARDAPQDVHQQIDGGVRRRRERYHISVILVPGPAKRRLVAGFEISVTGARRAKVDDLTDGNAVRGMGAWAARNASTIPSALCPTRPAFDPVAAERLGRDREIHRRTIIDLGSPTKRNAVAAFKAATALLVQMRTALLRATLRLNCSGGRSL